MFDAMVVDGMVSRVGVVDADGIVVMAVVVEGGDVSECVVIGVDVDVEVVEECDDVDEMVGN